MIMIIDDKINFVIDDKNKSLERKVIFWDAIAQTTTSTKTKKDGNNKRQSLRKNDFLINLMIIMWRNFDKHHDHYNLKAQEAGKVKLCCMTITTGPGTAFTNFQVFSLMVLTMMRRRTKMMGVISMPLGLTLHSPISKLLFYKGDDDGVSVFNNFILIKWYSVTFLRFLEGPNVQLVGLFWIKLNSCLCLCLCLHLQSYSLQKIIMKKV